MNFRYLFLFLAVALLGSGITACGENAGGYAASHEESGGSHFADAPGESSEEETAVAADDEAADEEIADESIADEVTAEAITNEAAPPMGPVTVDGELLGDGTFSESAMHLSAKVGDDEWHVGGTFSNQYDWDGDGEPDTAWGPPFTAELDGPERQLVHGLPGGVDFWVKAIGDVECTKNGEIEPCTFKGSDPEPFRVAAGATKMVNLVIQVGGEVDVTCDGSASLGTIIVQAASSTDCDPCDGDATCITTNERTFCANRCGAQNPCDEDEVCIIPTNGNIAACVRPLSP